jgi:hypothetical protein
VPAVDENIQIERQQEEVSLIIIVRQKQELSIFQPRLPSPSLKPIKVKECLPPARYLRWRYMDKENSVVNIWLACVNFVKKVKLQIIEVQRFSLVCPRATLPSIPPRSGRSARPGHFVCRPSTAHGTADHRSRWRCRAPPYDPRCIGLPEENKITLVLLSVRPSEHTLPMHLVVYPLPNVFAVIGPGIFSLACTSITVVLPSMLLFANSPS